MLQRASTDKNQKKNLKGNNGIYIFILYLPYFDSKTVWAIALKIREVHELVYFQVSRL